MTDERAVRAAVQAAAARFGRIDVLVNNAGDIYAARHFLEGDEAWWDHLLDVNLKGAFLCARQALKRMVKQRAGVILNTSSVHEVIAWSGYSAYAASKAGLSMLAKTLAQEAAPYNVRVLCIAPGAIKTPINQAVWSDPEGLKDLLTKIPLGRMGTPEDIAEAVAFLGSDAASYITGQVLNVDGGMVMA